MIESTHGLILRTRPLTETSLIIHWLTPESGRLATVAQGARRPQSPFAGKLDLFYVLDFSFSRSRRSELHRLREASLRETHRALRVDLFKLQQAGYAAGLVEQATETETPLGEIYALMLGFIQALCALPGLPQLVFALELKLLRELGLEPDWADTQLTPGAAKIAQALLADDWGAGARFKLSAAQSGELSHFLQGQFAPHLDRPPRGRPAALGLTT